MTRSLDCFDVNGEPKYTRLKYRHQLISYVWERFNFGQRKWLSTILKMYQLRNEEDINMSTDWEDVYENGFFDNISQIRNLRHLLTNRISEYRFNSESSEFIAESKLSRHIHRKFQSIEDWFYDEMYCDEYAYCEGCDDYVNQDDYYGGGYCHSCEEYNEQNSEDYDDEDCNPDYEHERYCSNYSSRVEDEISPKYLPSENVDTNLSRSKDTWYGLEWEVMARNSMPDDFPQVLTNENDWFMCKKDGSLDEGNGGFEICSAPSSYKFLKDRLQKLFHSDYWLDENGNTYVKGWNTGCAGIHLHISRRALTPLQIGKMLVFVNAKKNKRFIEDIAGRSMGRWCQSHEKNLLDGTERDSDRYQAVNTSNRNTVELRIFRSNVSENGLMRVLEFTDAFVHFLKQSSMNSVSYKDFMRYMKKPDVRANYPTFWAWLITNGYVVGNPNRSVSQQFESVSNQ
jgi:hypothetical protein